VSDEMCYPAFICVRPHSISYTATLL